MSAPTIDNHRAAVRLLGTGCPVAILAAQARCYCWRPFAQHTEEERVAYAADVAAVAGYVESRPSGDIDNWPTE